MTNTLAATWKQQGYVSDTGDSCSYYTMRASSFVRVTCSAAATRRRSSWQWPKNTAPAACLHQQLCLCRLRRSHNLDDMARSQGDVVVDRMYACSDVSSVDAGAGAIVAMAGVPVNGCLKELMKLIVPVKTCSSCVRRRKSATDSSGCKKARSSACRSS